MVAGITEYGKTIKAKLVELNQSQTWLCEEVATRTGLYFDSSYMHKVLTGKLSTPKVLTAINEILGIEG